MASLARLRQASSTPQLPVYRGRFGVPEAERLLWRAGFGPKPGESKHVAGLGLHGAVQYLTRPHSQKLAGPKPQVDGRPIDPQNVWGHDVLWWMDRMVRSPASGVERMTLIFHDWFATSISGVDETHMLAQNRMLRRNCLGTFTNLLTEVTRDPAMLLWLNGTQNEKGRPNENYGREMMELFTLGAGNGYTETDVRQMALSLTGWTNEWSKALGTSVNFRYDPKSHDAGVKTVFHHRGTYDWRDAVALAIANPHHPTHFVTKLWGYFIPTAPSLRDRTRLESLYTRSGYDVRAVVEAILMHPHLYSGPRMVKPPVVYIAGLLRAIGRPIDTDAWAWLTQISGQRPFEPPNVAGWDATRWLDTATWRGRWIAANTVIEGHTVNPNKVPKSLLGHAPAELVKRALATWGSPGISATTHRELLSFAQNAQARGAKAKWKVDPYTALTYNALLMLIATSPDLHTS